MEIISTGESHAGVTTWTASSQEKETKMKDAQEHAVSSRLSQPDQQAELFGAILKMMAGNFDRWMPGADLGTCHENIQAAEPVAEGIARRLVEAMAQESGELNAKRWNELVKKATRDASLEWPNGGPLEHLGNDRSFVAAVAHCTAATVAPAGSKWARAIEKRKQHYLRRVVNAVAIAPAMA